MDTSFLTLLILFTLDCALLDSATARGGTGKGCSSRPTNALSHLFWYISSLSLRSKGEGKQSCYARLAKYGIVQTPREWDEHAHYSLHGGCIVWMSSGKSGSTSQPLKTELWRISVDGSGQTPLTVFNDSASPMFFPTTYVAIPGYSSWSPDRLHLLVQVIINQSEQSEYSTPSKIRRINNENTLSADYVICMDDHRLPLERF